MNSAFFGSGEKAKYGSKNQKLWDTFNRRLMRRKKGGVAKIMVTLEDIPSTKKIEITDWKFEL